MKAAVLIALFITASFFMLIQTAQAATISMTGSDIGITKFPQEELEAQLELRNYIWQLGNRMNYEVHDIFNDAYYEFGSAINGYNEPYSIVYHFSHGNLGGWWHFYFWGWDYHDHYFLFHDFVQFYDSDIYPSSADFNVKFAIIWSCHSADVIGGMKTYPCGAVEPYGMPFAWMHTNALSTNGYVNPDLLGRCYIGFKGVCPIIIYNFTHEGCNGYNFLRSFFSATLIRKMSVNKALDYASYVVFKVRRFSDSVFYKGYEIEGDQGEMKVYGDGTTHLIAIGDLNHDKHINANDIGVVINAIQTQNLKYDFDADRKVNWKDLSLEFGSYLAWITRRYTTVPPIQTVVQAIGARINSFK